MTREPWFAARDPEPDDRAFFSLKQIADTARREDWPTGKTLVTARLFYRRKQAENSQASADA